MTSGASNKSNFYTHKLLYLVFAFLLVADLSYSFFQHYHQPFEGDIARSVVPSENVKQIFEDPLGLKVITENKVYLSPNRFFSHWFLYAYFQQVPSSCR